MDKYWYMYIYIHRVCPKRRCIYLRAFVRVAPWSHGPCSEHAHFLARSGHGANTETLSIHYHADQLRDQNRLFSTCFKQASKAKAQDIGSERSEQAPKMVSEATLYIPYFLCRRHGRSYPTSWHSKNTFFTL